MALADLDLRDETAWPDEDLYQLGQAVHTERVRRQQLAATEQDVADIIRAHQPDRQDGDPWVQPTGYMDAYLLGSIVTHNGKTWVATQNGTAGEPGVAGWREQQEEGQVVEWVAPHAGEEYPVGALVTHQGRTWRNDHTGPNGWEPGQPGSQWTDIGPA